MERIPVPRRGWVLVCDGAKALVLQNEGDAELLNLRLVDVIEDKQPPSRELGTERPGRVHKSHGESRSAVETVDLHDAAETAFLGRVADEIEGLMHERRARALVIVAPPHALGILRARMMPSMRHLITHELAKDLVGLPVGQIERHLAGG